MQYDLKRVAAYADEIVKIYGTGFPIDDRWAIHQKKLTFWAEIHINPTELQKPQDDRFHLSRFADALSRAAKYLMKRGLEGIAVAPDRQRLIETSLELLKLRYGAVYPRGKVKPPLPIVFPTDADPARFEHRYKSLAQARLTLFQTNLSVGRECVPQLNGFINSKPFQDLEKYLNQVLNKDTRKHSYFCGLIDLTEKRKVDVLHQFVTDLKSRSSMNEVKQFLDEFYRENNKKLNPSRSGIYEVSRFKILNSGQNITTYFFSTMGKQTTTVNLIDALAKSIGVDPKGTKVESFNRRSPGQA